MKSESEEKSTNKDKDKSSQNKVVINEEKMKKVNELFKSYILSVMDAEYEIEMAKRDLAERLQFNVEDAFRLFEIEGEGIIKSSDLKFGLNDILNIGATDFDIETLMNRFDLQKNGTLEYEDFYDIVVPFEENLREEVDKRESRSNVENRNKKIFDKETRQYLKLLFELLIKKEKKINYMKIDLKAELFNLGYLNSKTRQNESGEKVKDYIERIGITDPKEKISLFLIRIDRDRDGDIPKTVLIDELLSC